MKYLSFLFQFIINPKQIGAILPSSRYLGDKMVEQIDFQKANYIVEYGPGTGVFTEKLLRRRNAKTVILLVESNEEFCVSLKEKFKQEKNLIIVNGSAENIDQYLRENSIQGADYVISGLPFASLPKHISKTILFNTTKILKHNGKFITFQYTKIKMAFIEQFFFKIDTSRELRNMPPAYVLSCSMAKKSAEGNYGDQDSHCG